MNFKSGWKEFKLIPSEGQLLSARSFDWWDVTFHWNWPVRGQSTLTTLSQVKHSHNCGEAGNQDDIQSECKH